jgi:hypothetical protein
MKTIILSPDVLGHLDEWKKSNPKILIKIITLITEVSEIISCKFHYDQ